MKKLISALLSLIMVMSTIAVPAMAEDNIKVTLNGQEIQFDVQPQIINERTMVPVRAIFEALGASVEWDQTTQTVTSKKGDITISLGIDNPTMMVNNKKVELDQPACIIDERTLVPVRAISEAYNVNVEWKQDVKTVVLTAEITPNTTPVPTQTPTPEPIYDNVLSQVDQIKSYISKGMYLEAMELCDTTVANYNISPADKIIIGDLYDTAETKYDEYLESSKPVYTTSSFDSLKNSIISKGTYKSKYSKYYIEYYHQNSLVSLAYSPEKDEIDIGFYGDSSSSSMFVSLTIKRNQNTTGGLILEVSSSQYTMLFEYKNGRRVITYNEFPSSMSSSLNSFLDTSMKTFDTMLKIYTSVTLSDFGVYY